MAEMKEKKKKIRQSDPNRLRNAIILIVVIVIIGAGGA